MKKWIGTVLTLALVLTCGLLLLPEVQAATEGYYTYSVSNGKAAITDCDTAISGDITIPSTLGGYPVTEIRYRTFEDCTGLTGVSIPEGVTKIGGYAFYQCTGLTSISIPDSVTEIGGYAFGWCENLISVEIPDGVTMISGGLFAHCNKLTDVKIPDSVKTIGDGSFEYCWSLTAIDIPENVTEIGASAFFQCSALKDITVPEGVTAMKSYVFAYCTSLDSLEIPEGVVSISSHAFYNCRSLKRVVIPDNVAVIEETAFRDCNSLTELTIGKGVKTIGEHAFRNCSSLTELTIPDSVTTIQKYAFGECSSLTTVKIPDTVTKMGSDAFRECTGLTEVTLSKGLTSISGYAFWGCTGLKKIIIPEGVTTIGNYTFANCTGATEVTIPKSVTKLGNGAFYRCINVEKLYIADVNAWLQLALGNSSANLLRESSKEKQLFVNGEMLSKLEIPEGIASIPEYAFAYCVNLEEVTIPQSVTTIQKYAFSGCTDLLEVTIPDSVTAIGMSAFNGCKGLRRVNYAGTMTQWEQITIGYGNNCLENATLYAKDLYIAAISVKTLPAKIEYLTGEELDLTGLALKAVWTNETETEITEGFTVTGFDPSVIGQQTLTVTYEGMTATFSVLVKKGGSCGNGLRWILDDSGTLTITGTGPMTNFSNSEAVPWYQLRDEVKKVVIETGVTSIGKYAFSYCSNLEEVTIPSGSLEIGDRAFSGCIALTWIDLSNSSGYIGIGAFYGCNNITELDVSGRGLSGASLSGLGGLEKLTVSCSGLRGGFPTKYSEGYWSYDIPFGYFFGESSYEGGVKTAQYKYGRWYDYDLGGWYNTTEEKVYYYLPATLKSLIFTGDSIQPRAFSNCKSLTSVTLTKNIREIGYYAFCNCQGLTDVYYEGSEKEWQQITIEAQNNELTKATLHTVEPTAVGLSIVSLPAKTVYDQCDALDITGLVLEVTMSNGETMVITEGYTVSGYDSVLPGKQTITLWYEEVSTTFTVLVKEGGSCGDGLRWILDDSGTLTVTGTGAMTDFVNSEAVPWYQLRDQVKKVVIEKGVTSIGKYAFSYCGNLEEITIASGVTEIGGYAFERTHCLKQVVLPDGLQTLGSYLFYRSEGLRSITIPDSVTSLGASAFSRCVNLSQVTLGSGITKLGKYTFYMCAGLTQVTVPDSVTAIGDQVFEGCSGLTAITLSRYLTAIGGKAFSGCTALQNVYYRNTATNWAQITIGDSNECLLNATLHTRETFVASIIAQPESVLAKPGETAVFQVTAEGDGLSYRWQYRNAGATGWNNTSLTGYNTKKLTVADINGATHNGRQYRCVITDADGNTAISETVTITVAYMINDAKSQSAQIGEVATFKVNYSVKEGVTYQWQYKGNTAGSVWTNTTAVGNKTASITVTGKATNNRYMYRCIIMDPNFPEPIISKEVYLNIVEDAAEIIANPVDNSGVSGSYVNFTVVATGDGLSYQWQWSNDGGATWANTKGKGYSTETLSVKTNNFNSGYMYRCVVRTMNGNAWNRIYSEAATLTVLPAADIKEALPETVTVKAGENAVLHIGAEGSGLTYQWQWAKFLGNWKNTTMEGATTDTLTIPATADKNGRYYRVVITNTYGGYLETKYVQLIVE